MQHFHCKTVLKYQKKVSINASFIYNAEGFTWFTIKFNKRGQT